MDVFAQKIDGLVVISQKMDCPVHGNVVSQTVVG
jgi:hypothetical protein